jgi:hypothetical protein
VTEFERQGLGRNENKMKPYHTKTTLFFLFFCLYFIHINIYVVIYFIYIYIYIYM